jgi:hypothetical protein
MWLVSAEGFPALNFVKICFPKKQMVPPNQSKRDQVKMWDLLKSRACLLALWEKSVKHLQYCTGRYVSWAFMVCPQWLCSWNHAPWDTKSTVLPDIPPAFTRWLRHLRCSGLALQVQSPELKPQYHQKEKKVKSAAKWEICNTCNG